MPKYQNSMQDNRLAFLEDKFATINEEMGSVKVDMAQVKTDVSWLKKSYWVIATASIGGLITALFNLIG